MRNLNDEMPIHTERTVSIPKNQYSQFPKSLMDYSVKVNNKFLNDNLAVIEEIQHKDNKNQIPQWFRNYQKKVYQDSEILNHDNFFKSNLYGDVFKGGFDSYGLPKNSRYYSGMTVKDVGFVGSLQVPAVNGATLLCNDAAATTGGNSAGGIFCCRTDSSDGTVGELYDQIAQAHSSNVGNYRLACYDDSSGVNAILGETGSQSADSAYTWLSVTEFALTTAIVWVGMQVENSGGTCVPYYRSSGGVGTEALSQGYGVFATGAFGASSPDYKLKVGHS